MIHKYSTHIRANTGHSNTFKNVHLYKCNKYTRPKTMWLFRHRKIINECVLSLNHCHISAELDAVCMSEKKGFLPALNHVMCLKVS